MEWGYCWGSSPVLVAPGGAGAGRVGVTTPSSSMAGGSGASAAGGGSWLKALPGSAHRELWRCGDIALGSALPGEGLSPPLSPHGRHPPPQYLLICYKSCWDGAFQVTEEVTPPTCPCAGRAAEISNPRDMAEPGDMVYGWHQRGCRSPGHGTVGFPAQGQCQGPPGLSCPWTCQSPVSVVAFSWARCCGQGWKVAARGVRRRTGTPPLRWSLGWQVGPRLGGGGGGGCPCCRGWGGEWESRGAGRI